MTTSIDNGVSWSCRFHPTDWWHEVGCPHREWSKDDLFKALVAKKKFEDERHLPLRIYAAQSNGQYAEVKM